MKKSLFILLAAGVFAACGTKPEATVEGTVSGVDDGIKVYLLGDELVRLDSTVVEGGKFGFAIAKAYPDQNVLQFDGHSDRLVPFFVEPGIIAAMIDMNARVDDPRRAIFTGTPTNDAQAALREGTADFNERMNGMVQDVIAAQGTPVFDSLYAIYSGIENERGQYTRNVILGSPNTVFAAYMINSTSYNLTTPEMVDSVLTLTAGAPANAFTDKLVERRDALARTAVGVEAPDFAQAQPDGTPLSLSSLRGKLVLIDFWASWCGPCRRENPNVVKLYNRFKDKGFEILGVSLDDNRDNWLKAIEDDGLTWKHVSDVQGWSNAVAKEWAVRSIPHTVLVGADGVIIAKNLRGAALEAKVAEILGETK